MLTAPFAAMPDSAHGLQLGICLFGTVEGRGSQVVKHLVDRIRQAVWLFVGVPSAVAPRYAPPLVPDQKQQAAWVGEFLISQRSVQV